METQKSKEETRHCFKSAKLGGFPCQNINDQQQHKQCDRTSEVCGGWCMQILPLSLWGREVVSDKHRGQINDQS